MSTHTYVVLEISKQAFDEISARLLAAGYSHAFHSKSHGADRFDKDTVIDMHGIALKVEERD